MTEYTFADRYAEAGLQPSAEKIDARKAVCDKIKQDIKSETVPGLVQFYLGISDQSMDWFRDEFRTNDSTFSLIGNKREAHLLAALILGDLIASGNKIAIIGLKTAAFEGNVKPAEALWLQSKAAEALQSRAGSDRKPGNVTTTVKFIQTPKLSEEVTATSNGDWAALPNVLNKIRAEALENLKLVAELGPHGIQPLKDQLSYMREENQILWWLVGETSRTFDTHFSAFTQEKASLVAGVELGALSTTSVFGPLAAPAVLERMLKLAEANQNAEITLEGAIGGFELTELERLPLNAKANYPHMFPVMTAIAKAIENRNGWQGAFEKATGLMANTKFTAGGLSSQIYYEHLLGQVL